MSQDLSQRMQQLSASAAAQGRSRREMLGEAKTASSVSFDAQEAAAMKNNGVFQIMSKTNLSSDEQINQIADYLAVKGDDYAAARARFNEFQAYFDFGQNEGMKLDVKGLESLIEEVKGALKPEVERIVKDVIAVQEGVDQSKHLLEIMRTARLEGKSIEQIKQAIDINDRILAEIEKINKAMVQATEEEQFRQQRLNGKLDAKLASEKGVWNGIVRAVTGPDKAIAKQITDAQKSLQETQDALQARKTELEAKVSERNVNLEAGPMAILRSIDATDDGFAENIVNTANRSLELIQGASQSVQRLLHRMSHSKQQAFDISTSIAKAGVRQAILEGAIQRAAKNAHDNSELVKDRLTAVTEQRDGSEDPVEKAALSAERVGIAELQKAALAYEEDAKRTHSNFAMADGNTAEAQSRASNFYQLLLAQEDMLRLVSSQTLPETARALRMGLEVNVGMQTTELASSIQAVTRRAIQIGQESYASLATTQGELREADLKLMDDAIAALDSAQNSVVSAAEAQVKFSSEKTASTGKLLEATRGLRDMLEQYDDIRARTSDVMPPAVGPAITYGEEPVHPATPVNDRGAAATAKPEVA